MAFPPTFTGVWNTTFPPDVQQANLLGQDLRDFRVDVMERMSLLSGVLANRPTPETVNASWGGSGYGLLYFSTDDGKIYQWNGSSWVDITIDFITPPTPGIIAHQIATTGAPVVVDASPPPTVGQTLVATSPTNAIWQDRLLPVGGLVDATQYSIVNPVAPASINSVDLPLNQSGVFGFSAAVVKTAGVGAGSFPTISLQVGSVVIVSGTAGSLPAGAQIVFSGFIYRGYSALSSDVIYAVKVSSGSEAADSFAGATVSTNTVPFRVKLVVGAAANFSGIGTLMAGTFSAT